MSVVIFKSYYFTPCLTFTKIKLQNSFSLYLFSNHQVNLMLPGAYNRSPGFQFVF